MAVVRMFAAARAAAGCSRDELPGTTVSAVLEAAADRYGPAFTDVLGTCRIWVNGEPATDETIVDHDDEVAVLPPVSGGATNMDISTLRERRAELQALDDAVSYVRRVAQGRADLARDALAHAGDDGDPTPMFIRGGVPETLREVLSDRLLAAATGAHAPRPAEDHSDDPLAAELDALCAEHGFGRLDELSYSEVEALVASLDAFEQEVSARRRVLHAELDRLTEALVERLQEANPSGASEQS